MALLDELLCKLDQGYEDDESKRVSFQRDLVLWGINQPESELREQLTDASERVKRCEEQRTSCLVEMIGKPLERDPKSYCSSQGRLEILEREQQNCLLALQAREFFLEFRHTPEFDEFISAVV
jgi:hypothetical protein